MSEKEKIDNIDKLTLEEIKLMLNAYYKECQYSRSSIARHSLETSIINEILDGTYEGGQSDYETTLSNRIQKWCDRWMAKFKD